MVRQDQEDWAIVDGISKARLGLLSVECAFADVVSTPILHGIGKYLPFSWEQQIDRFYLCYHTFLSPLLRPLLSPLFAH